MTGLFRLYLPGSSPFHRLGIGWKYLLVIALTAPGLLLGNPLVSLALLASSLAAVAACGARPAEAWAVPSALWLLVAVIVAYQVIIGRPATGVVIGANLLTAVYASRVLTMTTPGPVLIDALVSALRPLRHLGVDPERVGLAVAIMVRSVPVLLDAFQQVRDAARARGQERNLLLLLTPVVVRAVGFAQATGAALAARGLGEQVREP